jgi:hypothetical protein
MCFAGFPFCIYVCDFYPVDYPNSITRIVLLRVDLAALIEFVALIELVTVVELVETTATKLPYFTNCVLM